jgi:hypothetical protein
MHEEDFALLREWLTNGACDANTSRQLFVANGDGIGEVMNALPVEGRPFLDEVLGASLYCDAFHGYTEDPDCAPTCESYCVRLLPPESGPFGTDLDVDAFGSGCPDEFRMNVLSTAGTGIGNRTYSAEDGTKDAEFAQIVNENLDAPNYRTVVAAPSWHHTTRRDPGGGEMDLCPRDLPSIVAGVASEIGAAMQWGFDAADNEAIPKFANAESLATCQETWGFPTEVSEPGGSQLVTRLYQNRPNPSHAGTVIRFSLAQAGPVKLVVYDVNGKHVRTLYDGVRDAGTHTVIWDGRNDDGRPVGSGVYWSQMSAGPYISNKKMIVLR